MGSEMCIRDSPYMSDLTYNGTPDSSNQAWVGLNRLELASIQQSSQNGVFKRLTHPAQVIQLRDIANHPDFDYDPFRISTQAGIHTINLRDFAE